MKNQRPIRVYLSASIVNAPANTSIAAVFKKAGLSVFLPQNITPRLKPRAAFEASVYRRCVAEMKKSDVGLLVLDSYGSDSAWEAGWYCGTGKPMVGWVESSFRFAQDWMVKTSLNAIFTNNKVLLQALKRDPVLRHTRAYLVANSADIKKALQEILVS